jgi:3-phenylpropionate/cinnamic acid dioxygenase small subunit
MAKKQKPRAKIATPNRRRATSLRARLSRAEAALDLHRCVLFVEREARLLDEAKFDDWLALFTADAWYWVPSEQEPRSRTSRIVGNVTIEDAEGRAATVRSKFLMIEYRREQQRLFAGTAWHRLVQLDGTVRIAWKRVDLVNCDAPLDGITQPF